MNETLLMCICILLKNSLPVKYSEAVGISFERYFVTCGLSFRLGLPKAPSMMHFASLCYVVGWVGKAF